VVIELANQKSSQADDLHDLPLPAIISISYVADTHGIPPISTFSSSSTPSDSLAPSLENL
jgi:hypothetical protein